MVSQDFVRRRHFFIEAAIRTMGERITSIAGSSFSMVALGRLLP